jgi:hypothetical protein
VRECLLGEGGRLDIHLAVDLLGSRRLDLKRPLLIALGFDLIHFSLKQCNLVASSFLRRART